MIHFIHHHHPLLLLLLLLPHYITGQTMDSTDTVVDTDDTAHLLYKPPVGMPLSGQWCTQCKLNCRLDENKIQRCAVNEEYARIKKQDPPNWLGTRFVTRCSSLYLFCFFMHPTIQIYLYYILYIHVNLTYIYIKLSFSFLFILDTFFSLFSLFFFLI